MKTLYYYKLTKPEDFEPACVAIYNLAVTYDNIDTIHVLGTDILDPLSADFVKKLPRVKLINGVEFIRLKARSAKVVNMTVPNTVVQTQSTSPNENNHTGNDRAVVVYVYYTEFLREICEHVKKYNEHTPVDVYFYVCGQSCVGIDIKANIAEYLINASIKYNVEFVPNKGRDVYSFLLFIKNNLYKNYKYICKIHTKKTTYLGPTWRTDYLKTLLDPNDDAIANNHHDQGIAQVSKYMILEKLTQRNPNWESVQHLASLMSINIPIGTICIFNAGTMFWCDNRYCTRLHKLIYDIDILNIFPDEPISQDGTAAHAWERLFWLI